MYIIDPEWLNLDGDNVIGVLLANGHYSNDWFDTGVLQSKLLLQMRIYTSFFNYITGDRYTSCN
jgi:hypothetical protein